MEEMRSRRRGAGCWRGSKHAHWRRPNACEESRDDQLRQRLGEKLQRPSPTTINPEGRRPIPAPPKAIGERSHQDLRTGDADQ